MWRWNFARNLLRFDYLTDASPQGNTFSLVYKRISSDSEIVSRKCSLTLLHSSFSPSWSSPWCRPPLDAPKLTSKPWLISLSSRIKMCTSPSRGLDIHQKTSSIRFTVFTVNAIDFSQRLPIQTGDLYLSCVRKQRRIMWTLWSERD